MDILTVATFPFTARETSFADFLARYGSYIDVTKHEVLIPFKVQFLSADVTVSLPEWMINEIKPEF